MAESIELSFVLNRRAVRLRTPSDRRLLDVLREDLRLTGAKEGCGTGDCGSCTVLLDGHAVNSCLVMAYQADGGAVETAEGLAVGETLHPIQEAFVERDAVHCGACAPGMLMAAKALLDSTPSPTVPDIRAAIAGNLCRCTGYGRIVSSIARAAGTFSAARPIARSQGSTPSYFRPRSLEEALEILAQRPGEARAVAGGTDAVLRARSGRSDAATFFDVTAVPEMQGIEVRGEELWLGALVTTAELAASPLVARDCPVLVAACATAGSVQIRNRATLGGSLAAALPTSDVIPALLASEAVAEIISISSRRDVAVADLFSGPSETVLAPDELIVGIRVPRRVGVRGAFARLAGRQGPALAKASVAVAMAFKEGRPEWVRVAAGMASRTAVRAVEAEKALMRGGYDALLKAKVAIREELAVVENEGPSGDYRRELTPVLLERAIRDITEG